MGVIKRITTAVKFTNLHWFHFGPSPSSEWEKRLRPTHIFSLFFSSILGQDNEIIYEQLNALCAKRKFPAEARVGGFLFNVLKKLFLSDESFSLASQQTKMLITKHSN